MASSESETETQFHFGKLKATKTLTALKPNVIFWDELLCHEFVDAALRGAVEIAAEDNRRLRWSQIVIGDGFLKNMLHEHHRLTDLQHTNMIGIRLRIQVSISD